MQQLVSGGKNAKNGKNAKSINDVNTWDSTTITQFELAKVIYTSGFLQTCNLTATAKLVLMALIQHYNANNAEMFPSQRFLAQQLGISEKSVERAIANLRDEDFIYYVTHRVNRYRFTAHFFEEIKMSVVNRQNVGCGIRQNVGQTNKEEKRKEKGNFLDFSCFGLQAEKKFFENGADAPQTSTFEQALKKDLEQQSTDFVEVWQAGASDKLSAARSLKHSKADLKLASKFNGSPDLNPKDDINSQQSQQQTQPQCFSRAKFEKNKPQKLKNNNDGATSPLEWSREDALKWVQSLAPVFRSRGIAKTLTQKHNYTDEELWGSSGAQNQEDEAIWQG